MPAGTQDGGSEDQLKRGYLRGGPRRTGCGLLRRGGRAHVSKAAVWLCKCLNFSSSNTNRWHNSYHLRAGAYNRAMWCCNIAEC